MESLLVSEYHVPEVQEYLTDPKNSRLTVYPIVHPDIWELHKKQLASFWTVEELSSSFKNDYNDYQKLNENEKFFIKNILAFFAASDTIVNMNITENFTKDITVREVIIAYEFQTMMENIHGETYSLMIDNIIKDKDEKNECFNAIENMPCVAKKAQWAIKYKDDGNLSLAQRILAFAIVEGVYFSASFCSIYWLKLKKGGIMQGLTSSNELISKDENSHCEFACLLYNKFILNRVPQRIVHNMFKEAVEIEREFICESLPCSLIGMNSDLMHQYVQYVADSLLVDLKYEKIWNVKNPFDWMEQISLSDKNNFFEKSVGEYQKASVLNENSTLEVLDDF